MDFAQLIERYKDQFIETAKSKGMHGFAIMQAFVRQVSLPIVSVLGYSCRIKRLVAVSFAADRLVVWGEMGNGGNVLLVENDQGALSNAINNEEIRPFSYCFPPISHNKRLVFIIVYNVNDDKLWRLVYNGYVYIQIKGEVEDFIEAIVEKKNDPSFLQIMTAETVEKIIQHVRGEYPESFFTGWRMVERANRIAIAGQKAIYDVSLRKGMIFSITYNERTLGLLNDALEFSKSRLPRTVGGAK